MWKGLCDLYCEEAGSIFELVDIGGTFDEIYLRRRQISLPDLSSILMLTGI